MTCARRDGKDQTPLLGWVRRRADLDSYHYGYSIHDVDIWIHQYQCPEDKGGPRRLNNLMLIEEKRFMRKMDFAQSDTLCVVAQILPRLKGNQPALIRVQTAKGNWVLCRWWGCHILTYSGSSIEDSDSIYWDARSVSVETLASIIGFRLSPITLIPRGERRHHAFNPMLPGFREGQL